MSSCMYTNFPIFFKENRKNIFSNQNTKIVFFFKKKHKYGIFFKTYLYLCFFLEVILKNNYININNN